MATGAIRSDVAMRLPQLQNLMKRDPEGYLSEFQSQYRNYQSQLRIYQLEGSARPIGLPGSSHSGEDGFSGFSAGSLSGSEHTTGGFGDEPASAGLDAAAAGPSHAANKKLDRLMELITFVSHVVPYYTDAEESQRFPRELIEALGGEVEEINDGQSTGKSMQKALGAGNKGDLGKQKKKVKAKASAVVGGLTRVTHVEKALSMPSKLRLCMVNALILMRNRGVVGVLTLSSLFFPLIAIQDKYLRDLLSRQIVADIRNVNRSKGKDKINRQLQTVVFNLIAKEENEVTAKKALQITVELFRRRVWTDARTVNAIAAATTAKSSQLMVIALHFFLGIDEKIKEDDKEDDEAKDEFNPALHRHSKKTRSRARQCQRMEKQRKKMLNKSKDPNAAAVAMFPALEMIHDPQGLAEKLFSRLRRSTEKFEVRLLMLDLITRLIGYHQLLVLPLYTFIQRYIASHQKDVTKILACLVQGCHSLVPPEELLPVVRAIANNLISERCSEDSIAVGINTIREIISRVPLVLGEGEVSRQERQQLAKLGKTSAKKSTDKSEESSKAEEQEAETSYVSPTAEGIDALVQDLVMFSKSKDKGVMVAARSVINLIREVHPTILKRKDRGKFHNAQARPRQYGESKVMEGVEGAELLQEAEEKGLIEKGEGDEEGDEWKVQEETKKGGKKKTKEEEDGWVDVEHSDSDEDEEEGREGCTEGEMGEDEEEEEDEEDMWEEEEIEEEESEEEDGEGGEEEDGETEREGGTAPTDQPQPAKSIAQKDRIDAQRILTPKDFERIALLKKAQEKKEKDPKNRRKRPRGQEEEAEGGELGDLYQIAPDQLEGIRKRRRATLEERLQSILEGREKWTHKTKRGGGSTNKEKQRKKNFLMVRKGNFTVRSKLVQSAKQLQGKHNRKVKTMLKREKRKRRRA